MHRAGVDNTSTFETRAGHILGAPPTFYEFYPLSGSGGLLSNTFIK